MKISIRQHTSIRFSRHGLARLGATLTEVLMALLITGIGLSSLATLFPLSVLRSVQANQLTVGTQHRFTAEALLDLYPQLFADPDNVDNNSDGDRWNDHASERFFVDPLGRALTLPATLGALNRYHAGFSTEANADKICTSPDSWVTQIAEIASSSTDTTATLTKLANQNVTLGGPSVRAVLFNADQTASQIRYLVEKDSSNNTINSTPLGNTITWEDPLPANFGSVGEVRIEMEERRFTWMLTVRGHGSSSPGPYGFDVDVVIFFRRSFESVDEPQFELTVARGSRIATVTWASGVGKPYLKKGGYVLDAGSGGAYWYQIADFDASNITNGMQIALASPAVRAMNNAPSYFMKGVVDVYPLGPKSSPSP